MNIKTCKKCGIEKGIHEFHKHKGNNDGRLGKCKACHSKYCAEYYIKNKKRLNKESKLSREKNKERDAKLMSVWQKNNKEKCRKNSDKWSANNKGKRAASLARYRAAKIMATPVWANLEAIKEIYELSAAVTELMEPTHVDHIVPLRGENVCGLHVGYNLQVLRAEANMSKGNKII